MGWMKGRKGSYRNKPSSMEAVFAAEIAQLRHQYALEDQEMEAILGTPPPRGTIAWAGAVANLMYNAGAETAEVKLSSGMHIRVGMEDSSDQSFEIDTFSDQSFEIDTFSDNHFYIEGFSDESN